VAVDGDAEERHQAVDQPVELVASPAQVVDEVGQVDGEVGQQDQEDQQLAAPAEGGQVAALPGAQADGRTATWASTSSWAFQGIRARGRTAASTPGANPSRASAYSVRLQAGSADPKQAMTAVMPVRGTRTSAQPM
jgi:hypothetical protein